MVYILIAILIFGVLIAVHEFGHFLAAKACGVRVNEFSIGMGPQLFHKTKGDTEYSLRLLPIGGYCAMEGEDEDSDDDRALGRQVWWKKFIIFVAGAFMNFLTGLIIVICLYAGVLHDGDRRAEPRFSAAGRGRPDARRHDLRHQW